MAKRGKAAIPANEVIKEGMTDAQKDAARSAKFSRLASKRIAKADKAIRNIGQLSGRSYRSTPAQVAQLLKYLQDAVSYVQQRFSAPTAGPSQPEFKI